MQRFKPLLYPAQHQKQQNKNEQTGSRYRLTQAQPRASFSFAKAACCFGRAVLEEGYSRLGALQVYASFGGVLIVMLLEFITA